MNLPYEQYVHTLTMAYRQFGVGSDTVVATIDESPARLLGETAVARSPGAEDVPIDASAHEMVSAIAAQIRRRLDLLPHRLGDQITDKPSVHLATFEGAGGTPVSILIPILNQQGRAWYFEAPRENFDFRIEQAVGLLEGARTIYDFGSHHGVYSAFYSSRVGKKGLVWAFEPSILNIEISSLLFLLNGISNVINVAAAVGARTDHLAAASRTGMLVDFVDEVHVVDLGSIAWRKADFLKMDIEGFEYDLLTAYPWVFDLAIHMHVELHIPHLERRGLDYREVVRLLPFDKFDVLNYQRGVLTPIDAATPLAGYCSLMMKRRLTSG